MKEKEVTQFAHLSVVSANLVQMTQIQLRFEMSSPRAKQSL